MDFAKGIAEKITQIVMNYSDVEIKVREATNDDPWGPAGSLMQELAYNTNRYEGYADVMCMLWKRMLQDNKNNWRRVYKSLVLLSFLLRHGSDKVVMSALEHLYDMKFLINYSCIDDHGKDKGACVRQTVKDVINLLEDKERLHSERLTAQKNKAKFVGISGEFSGDYVDSYDSNDNDKQKNGSYHSEDWQGNEYRDHDDDDDDDDDGLKRYKEKIKNSERNKHNDKSNHGNCNGKTWKRVSNSDDEFNPRESEEPKRVDRSMVSSEDDGFGEFTQYEPKTPLNNGNDNMLTFDTLDDINTFSPSPIIDNNMISPPIVNNKVTSSPVVNGNGLPGLGAINPVPMNSVPLYPTQGNVMMMMMMQPQLSPGLFHFPAGVPVANQGCFNNFNNPMSSQLFGPTNNYQARPTLQGILPPFNQFQAANQKSLI